MYHLKLLQIKKDRNCSQKTLSNKDMMTLIIIIVRITFYSHTIVIFILHVSMKN